MSDVKLEKQVAELNQKVDLLLEYVNQQRLKSETVEDLVADLSIVGTDMYNSTVETLDMAQVEIDPNEVRNLIVRFVKNIKNFNQMLDLFENVLDFTQDAGPIANEVLIDFSKKLHEFEQKGYFDFLNASGKILDNLVQNYSAEELEQLSERIGLLAETSKNLTQPEVLNAANNTLKALASIDFDTVKPISLWQAFRQTGKPEFKKALGIAFELMKNINNTNNSN